jgi:hypothetical protein
VGGVIAYHQGGDIWVLPPGGTLAYVWSSDGRRIYYQLNTFPSTMMAVDVASADPFQPGPPVPVIDPWPYFSTVLVTGHDILSDGSFVTIEAPGPGDGRQNAASEVHVVLNFMNELRRRVPD